jgi:hypothetical protein
MKPKTATISTKESGDSFESPPISIVYSEEIIPCENSKELFSPGSNLSASCPTQVSTLYVVINGVIA